MPCTGPARSSKRDPERKDARYVVRSMYLCTYVLCSRDISTLADIRTQAPPPRILCRWQGPLQQKKSTNPGPGGPDLAVDRAGARLSLLRTVPSDRIRS
jgi:hypothetical protein